VGLKKRVRGAAETNVKKEDLTQVREEPEAEENSANDSKEDSSD
jgi:hypothetical protein